MPFGVPGWKWKVGRFGYVMEKEPSYKEIKEKAKALLEKATKGPAWHCRYGTFHVPLLVDGEIVGELWEDVEPRELEVGAYWHGKWGTKVQLVKNGRVVGLLWLA
ncbi:hypothetical protein QDY65_00290 [Pyrococcus kukulkanii]|uniref:hypothetical protein n=1 Tax=Pyrococcus kukulkanii TaxID=1609559 RepID=UPI0035688141